MWENVDSFFVVVFLLVCLSVCLFVCVLFVCIVMGLLQDQSG